MVFLIIVAALVLGLLIFKIHKDYVILAGAKRIKTVSGADVRTIAPYAPSLTIFGNNFDLISMEGDAMFSYFRKMTATLGKSYIQYILNNPIYNVVNAADAELIFNDKRLITKSLIYKFILPFIRTGLLTSTGSKWHSRRKLMSPAFHFNILEPFLEIFKEESQKFVNTLAPSNGKEISLTELIPRVTLNAICETALGIKLDNMAEGDTYREHLHAIELATVKRISNPLYINDFCWDVFGNAKDCKPAYEGVHQFSSDIIKKRRAMFAQLETAKKMESAMGNDSDIFMSAKKQRYAMLYKLIMAEKEGLIDHIGICEEVDTIIFEGFDTTSMGLIFAIMNLSLHPEMQEKCFKELDASIDDDLSQLTTHDINKLEYLDRFLKESLRMYPSVPLIGREAAEETVLPNNIILPKGAQINVHLYDILRDPKQFKNPNKFDPDRFLQENMNGRHPYAFVPFSAGSRNCIGQKMAMLELKTVLLHVIKNYEILPAGDHSSYTYGQGFLLRVTQDVRVRIVKRK